MADHPGGHPRPTGRTGPRRRDASPCGTPWSSPGPADEHHTLCGAELGQVLVHHVVLTLPPGEADPRHAGVAGEAVHRRAEPVADLGQRRGRGDRQPQLPVFLGDQTSRVLQPWDVDVAAHPVDALDLENHMIVQDIANTARYIHDRLRPQIRRPAPTGQLLPQGSHTPVTAQSSRVILPNQSPHTRGDHGMAARAGAKPRWT